MIKVKSFLTIFPLKFLSVFASISSSTDLISVVLVSVKRSLILLLPGNISPNKEFV